MTMNVSKNDTKQPALSEKALRLLAAHDREIKGMERFLSSGRKANRWS